MKEGRDTCAPRPPFQTSKLDFDSQFACYERAELDEAVAITPLVVVPSEHFDHVFADDHGEVSISDGGVLVALEVD